jgi:hypothetical protein
MALNKQTELDIAELLKGSGHTLTLEDVADIQDLDAIACRISSREDKETAQVLSYPTLVGGVWLYPPRIAGLLWYEQHAPLWDDAVVQLVLMAFAMSFDEPAKPLAKLADPRAAYDAAIAWGKTLNCSTLELNHIVKAMLGNSKADDPDETHWPLVSFLCREYGQSPRYWIDESPIGEIIALCNEYGARIDRQIEQSEKASKKSVKTIVHKIAGPVKQYREKLKSIREKWSASNGK